MWALFSSLTIRYLPSNPQNKGLYEAAATKKSASQQNYFAHHQRSVRVSDGISWQVNIGLYQFDNCLSRVKIDVTAVTSIASITCYKLFKISGEFFIFQQDSVQAHRSRKTTSFPACNFAKCWLITGSIARSAKRWYLCYSVGNFEVFASHGRHVAPSGVKCATAHSSVPNFTPNGAKIRV